MTNSSYSVRKTVDRTNNPCIYMSKPEHVNYKVSKKSDYFGISLSIHNDTLEIYEFGKDVFKLPVKLKSVIDCVKKAQNILRLEDNWDNEGSEGYLSETWLAVVYFLFYYGEQIYLKFGYCIDIPKIYPSSKGSIDIDWETDSYGLIINVAKGGEQATYYGDNKGHQMTEGVFNPRDFNINLLPKAITEARIFSGITGVIGNAAGIQFYSQNLKIWDSPQRSFPSISDLLPEYSCFET